MLMETQATPLQNSAEVEIRSLYKQLIDSWNRRNAADFAVLFYSPRIAMSLASMVAR